MNLLYYYNPENFYRRLIFLALLLMPFHSLTSLLVFVFISYKIWRKKYQEIIEDNVSKGIFLLSLLLAVSCTLAYKIGEAWLGMPLFLPFFWVFLALRTLFTDYKHLYFITLPIIFNSFLVMFFGIAELNFGWVSSDFLYLVLGWQLTGAGEPAGRLASIFPYANLAALYFVIVIIFTIALLIDRRKNSWQKFDWFLVITIILNGICLALTSSRNAWIICFLSLVAFCIYLGWNWILQLLTLGAILVIGASFGSFPGQGILRRIVPSFLWTRFSDTAFPNRPVETLRITQWEFCWDLFKQRPFLGWGLRNFSVLYEQQMAIYLGHPHNFFLMLLAETGIVNLALFLAIVGWILSRGCLAFVAMKKNGQETIMFFSLLIVMGAYSIYNLADINLFDFRLNTIAWFVLACISGVSEKVLKKPQL